MSILNNIFYCILNRIISWLQFLLLAVILGFVMYLLHYYWLKWVFLIVLFRSSLHLSSLLFSLLDLLYSHKSSNRF